MSEVKTLFTNLNVPATERPGGKSMHCENLAMEMFTTVGALCQREGKK